MDLNQPPVDNGLSGEVQQSSAMGSIHIQSNQVRSEENSERRSEASGMIPNWLAQVIRQGNNSHQALEQFQKLNPPVEGVADPLQVEKWLLQIENILDVMNCTKDQNVYFAAFRFQGEAEHLWRMIRNNAKASKEKITWEYFIQKFNEKYIPELAKNRLASEFLELK